MQGKLELTVTQYNAYIGHHRTQKTDIYYHLY